MHTAKTLPVLVACLLALAVSPAWAQSAAPQSNIALVANDHYTRSHDYDLVHQRIVLSAFNWDSTSFEGSVTTTLISKRAGLRDLILDEGVLLVNTKVTDAAGHTLSTSRHGDTLVVSAAKPLRFGEALIFTIVYHGTIKSGRGLTYLTNDGREHRPNQIWSQGEAEDNHYWFPTYDFPNDKMTWELVATVPKASLAISNGRLVSNLVTGDSRTMTWRQETPSSTYLVSLVVAPLAVVHDSWQGVPVDYYTYHEDSTRAWPLFRVTPDMIGVYSRLTGIRYPWAKYAQTTVADFFGGMENVSATTLVDWLPDARAYRDRPWYQYILIPHELAHQWFGDYVTTDNWANAWLNEGFAEYLPGQYWNEKLGAHAAQDYYADEYEQFIRIEAGRSMPLASLGSNNIYPKGALMLEMLKDYLGPERFWASIHSYLSRHAFGTATSDDLRQAVLAATGENLDWFWDEWIYGAGYPKLTVAASYDAGKAQLSLAVKQTQIDSFTVDSTGRLFRVAPAFRMPVAIRVGYSGGEVSYRGQLNAREQTFVVDGVKSAPTMVVFDDGNHILKQLEFEQATAWLAEQLTRDANLWNRRWAIAQLGKRQSDPVAAAALASAATTADFYVTRIDAIEALSGFPAATALGPLTAATRDTSAAVRSAAFTAIGPFGGKDIVTLARAAFAADSSYQVRAAALGAAVLADSAHTHALIGQALATPSYLDAIQNAALRLIMQTNDTTQIAQVDNLIGHQSTPARVLATLGARGSRQAVDRLTGHLTDPRVAVRRWTVAAFQSTLARANRPLALKQLQASVGGIGYADTRQQVTELIVTLEKPTGDRHD